MTRTAAGSNGLLRVAGRGRWTPEEEQRKLEGSEGRSAHRGAACRRPARPRCRPQSRTALPPRSAAPGPAAAPCAPPYGRSKLHRRPSEPLAGGRHRAAAPRLREHYPVYARAPCAHTVWTAPKPVLRAGGRVAATAPAPSSAGRSSAIIAGCTAISITQNHHPPGSPGVHSQPPYNYILIVCSSMGKFNPSMMGRFFRADNPVRCTGNAHDVFGRVSP